MTRPSGPPPDWALPEGVNAALWEYAHTDWLAESEDGYFLDHPLFQRDLPEVAARFTQPAPLIDLGCGVGRAALHFAAKGFPVVAVELSHAMLRKVGQKARAANVRVGLLEANLCALGCLPDASFAYAVSLFSTIGMIRGREPRRRALSEAARLLRPGGRMALHAHNIFLNAHDSQGRRWLLSQIVPTLLGRDDAGDREMTYRGIPNMQVHLYRWRELKRDLARAGLRIDESLPLDTVTAATIPAPWLLPSIRAGGWLLFLSRAR
jgi:ubiquinone/menaquinone biosynthesis C-methylase UbiE